MLSDIEAQDNAVHSGEQLKVLISGFKNNRGMACVAVFNNSEAFPKSANKAVATIYSKIVNNQSEAVFENLSPGEYAVSVYHDENDNKKLDVNFLGIPKEGVGASNDAKGHLGPPKYQDAKFMFKRGNETISIKITYL
jgi:uncharacterized protein (DUF2141 family)